MFDDSTSSSDTADTALLELITQGDEQALGVLYDRYDRLVFSIALHMLGDRNIAEEITQDVFHAVWQHSANFQTARGSVGGWLIGITRHRAIDETRSRGYRARDSEQAVDDTLDTLPSRDSDFADGVVNQDLVSTALGVLPASQRQAIQLTYYGGLNSREIGEMLNISTGTVKTRLRLAFQKLSPLLQLE